MSDESHLVELLTFRNAIKAVLLVASEYAMLALIEDAPVGVKIATALVPAMAFLAIQYDQIINNWHRSIVPAALGALITAYIAIVSFGIWLAYWQPKPHSDASMTRRSEIREQLAKYIGESEAMQRTCEDEHAAVPDIPQWKAQVEQFLETLGHEYVIRFREGVSEAGLGGQVDAAHQACWTDLHVREKNLDRFFDDFRPSGS
jgi:hypothetical protein